jgi:hypothetical protein
MFTPKTRLPLPLSAEEVELMRAYYAESFTEAFAGVRRYMLRACGEVHARKTFGLTVWAGARLCRARSRRWSFESFRTHVRILLALARVDPR